MKILQIAWKDTVILFRDRIALLFMLAAPLILTFGMALVSGRLSGSGSSAENIPVAVVNLDRGDIGQKIVDAFQSAELSELLAVTSLSSAEEAKKLVEDNKTAAAIVIPAGFTDAITGKKDSTAEDQIEVYANPEREVSSGVATAVVEAFVQDVELARVSGQVAVEQMLAAGLINPADAAAAGRTAANRALEEKDSSGVIQLVYSTASQKAKFDPMNYFAPSMAILFLMYTVTLGGRSLLNEKETGTLTRLSSAPISSGAILGGKMLGVFFIALLQMAILLAANAILFGVQFGDPVALAALTLALVLAASCWGILLASAARTAGQISTVGMAMMLTFGILGGTFFSTANMPPWFQLISKITPNAWGIEGFVALAYGDGLLQIAGKVAGLLVMAALLFALSILILRRRNLLKG